MYDFVTHTWNPVKGPCDHGCTYCYMEKMRRRFRKDEELRFDEKELETNLGKGNFIFVGSGTDFFAANIPEKWITDTLDYCDTFDNRYLFQSKNPARIIDFMTHPVFRKAVVCTTIETNRQYDCMGNTPATIVRANKMEIIKEYVPAYITIEPIIDFDLPPMVAYIKKCRPKQVNIGADTGHNHLPEPTQQKVVKLIDTLSQFTTVKLKSNLKRIISIE